MRETEVIFDGAHLRAVLHPGRTLRQAKGQGPGGATCLMVTFDYRMDGKTGFSPDTHSTGFARTGLAQLCIKTRVNDWFINPETAALEQALIQLAPAYAPVQMLGFSMGGYAAFRFAGALRARSVLAVSPQISIHPAAAPFEHRYRAEAPGFDPVLGALGGRDLTGLQGLILLDPFIAADLAHARALQALCPGVRLVRLGFGGHPAFDIVRARGQTWTLQREAAARHPDPAMIRAAHRAGRRQTVGYWDRLALFASARHPALARRAQLRAAALRAGQT